MEILQNVFQIKKSLKIEDKNNDNLLLPYLNNQINILSLINNLIRKSSFENIEKDIIIKRYEQLHQKNERLNQENVELKKLLEKSKQDKE